MHSSAPPASDFVIYWVRSKVDVIEHGYEVEGLGVNSLWKVDENGRLKVYSFALGGFLKDDPQVTTGFNTKLVDFWMIWGTTPTSGRSFRRDGCTRCSSSGENRLRRPSHLLSQLYCVATKPLPAFSIIFHVFSSCM